MRPYEGNYYPYFKMKTNSKTSKMKQFLSVIIILFLAQQTFFGQENKKDEPSGKVLGEFFGDYFYKVAGDTGNLLVGTGQYQQTVKDRNGFEIRRFNLGYEYNFNSTFYARLMLEGNDGFTNEKSTRIVYIKYAFLEWKNIFKGSKLTIGAQSTPTFGTFVEKIWSYRSVEKEILDFHKYAGSNDVGISLSGKFNEPGTLNYYLMVGNGRSTSVENNNYKRLYGSVYGSLFDKHFLFQLYTDYERQSPVKDAYLFQGFLGYQNEKITIGAEPFNRLVVNDTLKNESAFGLELFARGPIIKDKLNGLFRIDLFNPNTKIDNAGYNETFIVFGLDYTPMKNIDIIPNIWINSYNTKGNTDPDRKGDVVARITFRYKL